MEKTTSVQYAANHFPHHSNLRAILATTTERDNTVVPNAANHLYLLKALKSIPEFTRAKNLTVVQNVHSHSVNVAT